MLYQGSYLNGFAPRDFEPAYPDLWRGCVGAWCPSLGPTGGVLRDWSGRQNHGTLTNTTLDTVWTNEQGYCVDLDGSNDFIQISTAGLVSNVISLSFWIKTSSVAGYQAVLGSSASEKYEVYVRNGDQVYATLSGSNDATWPLSVTLGEWQHFVLVAQSGVEWILYRNGSAIASPSHTGTYQVDGSSVSSVTIGVARNPAFGFFDGNIDDVRIYNRTLNYSGQSLLYSNGRGRGIAYSFNQPHGSLTPGESSGSSGSTFPGLAWRALRRWRFVVRAGVDGNWPRVT